MLNYLGSEKIPDVSRYYGATIGIVTNNQDSDKSLARIKVKLPVISGDIESDWIRIVTPMAGKEMGIFFLPEVGDEVLIIFEHGDINRPYVLGSLWGGTMKPPETNSDGENNLRFVKTRSGHVLRFTDKSGEEKIEIIDKTEKNKIEFDTANNKITITSDADIDITAANGAITIAAKTVKITGDDGVTIESSGGKLAASGSSGADLKSDGKITIDGVSADIKGSPVNIN